MISSCATRFFVSPHCHLRRQSIRYVVIHGTASPSSSSTHHTFLHPESKVSAHYVVDRDGCVSSYVKEHYVAYHAGQSVWKGTFGLNGCSVGVEIENDGHQSFADAQYDAVDALLHDVSHRYGLCGRDVVYHTQISPWRKKDPFAHFDYERMRRAGWGICVPCLDDIFLKESCLYDASWWSFMQQKVESLGWSVRHTLSLMQGMHWSNFAWEHVNVFKRFFSSSESFFIQNKEEGHPYSLKQQVALLHNIRSFLYLTGQHCRWLR